MVCSQWKAQERRLEEEKATRPTKDIKSGKPSQNDKEELKSTKSSQNSKLPLNQFPLILSMQALPLDNHYHVSSLNHPVSNEFNQLYAHTLPLWQ
jgi:hypothetical protein